MEGSRTAFHAWLLLLPTLAFIQFADVHGTVFVNGPVVLASSVRDIGTAVPAASDGVAQAAEAAVEENPDGVETAADPTIVPGGDVDDTKFPVNAKCQTLNGRSRWGPSLVGTFSVRNAQGCCAKCDAALACFSWNFEKATGKCYLLNGVSNTRRDPRFISGVNS